MMSTMQLHGRFALLIVLMAASAAGTWQVQEWRYGKQMADQANLHQTDLTAIGNAAAAQVSAARTARLALEKTLAISDQTHHLELSNAQRDQARLRDRLATADLRLSVILAPTDSAGGCSVPATSKTGGLVHGVQRAQLDSAHAQRIIGITDDGDRGLIALAACQGYVRELVGAAPG